MMSKSDFEPVAYMGVTSSMGLEICIKNEGVDDYVYSRFVGIRNDSKITRGRVLHNEQGHPYFIKYGSRYYLSDFTMYKK